MSETPEERPLELATELSGEVGREAGPAVLNMVRKRLIEGASRPGTKTSEYKLAALGLLGALGLVGFGAYSGDAEMQSRGIELAKWCIVGYAGSRGAAKIGAGIAAKPNE